MNGKYLALGAALIAAWFLTRDCCDFRISPAIDRPIRSPNQEEETNRRQSQPSRGGGGGGGYHPGPGGGGGGAIHKSIPSIQPKQQSGGGGSYWDWLKSGGGLNPNNPYHPFPGALTPGAETAPEIVAWGKHHRHGHPIAPSDDRNISSGIRLTIA